MSLQDCARKPSQVEKKVFFSAHLCRVYFLGRLWEICSFSCQKSHWNLPKGRIKSHIKMKIPQKILLKFLAENSNFLASFGWMSDFLSWYHEPKLSLFMSTVSSADNNLVPWASLQFVIVVFPDHTHLLFWIQIMPDKTFLRECAHGQSHISLRCSRGKCYLSSFFQRPSVRFVLVTCTYLSTVTCPFLLVILQQSVFLQKSALKTCSLKLAFSVKRK